MEDVVDNLPLWITAKTIYASHYLHYPVDRRPHWFVTLKYMLDRGLVFRECTPYRHTRCKPSMMEKQGSKWVWKEKSQQELEACDIHLGQTAL